MALKEWKKYIVTLAITVAIFGTTIAISMWIDNARVNNVRSLQDSISLNILSSETQFNLLKDADCEDLFNSDLAAQLTDMGNRLSFLESTGHSQEADFISLKQYYYLLEIKDYMLTSSATKCPLRPVSVAYFYQPNCSECDKQGNVLSYLRQRYPDNIRVYSFDYSLDISAVHTLANLNKIEKVFPSIIVDGKTYTDFQSVDDIIAANPKITTNRIRIVLSPHLGDATLSVGGLLAKSTHSANSPLIATIFAGIPKTPTSTTWDTKSGFKDSSEAMARRLVENNDSAYVLGSQYVNFGYLDSQYRGPTATTTLVNKITADIIKLIGNYDTSTSSIEIYGPAIFPTKIEPYDNAILHNAYMKVIEQYKPRGRITFFVYEDFPYAQTAGAQKVDITKTLRTNAPQFSYAPIYIPLTEDVISTKKDSLQSYDSQIKAMAANGWSDVVTSNLGWTKNRCKEIFKVPSSCEVVYQVQK